MKNHIAALPAGFWKFIRFLVEPPPDITDILLRRQVRLLSSFLLVIIPLGSTIATIQLLTVPGFLPTFLTVACAIVVMSIAYVLTRTRHYLVAAILTAITPSIASYAALLTRTPDESSFGYLLIGVVLSSILLNSRFTLGIAALNLIGLLFLPGLQPFWTSSVLAGKMGYHVFIPALIVIAMWHRDTVEHDRQRGFRESELKFRSIFDNSVDAIGVSTVGVHVVVNPAYVKMFGYKSADQLVGQPILNLIAPSHREQILDFVRRRAAGENVPSAYVTRGLRCDGTEFDMEVHVSTYELGGERYTVPILRDITQLRQADTQLRYQANLLQNVSDAIVASDLNFKIVSWNQAAEALYGWQAEEAIGRPVHEILQTKYLDESADQVKQQFTDRGFWKGEVIQNHKAGTRLHILSSVSSVMDEDGQAVGVVAVNRDITQRKQMEEALRISEKAYANLLKNIAGAVYRCRNDQDWTVEYISEGCMALTGFHPDEIVESRVTSLGALMHPEDAGPIWDKCQINLAARLACSNEYRIYHRNGGMRWVWDQAQGVYSETGELIYIEGLLTDITDRRQAEEALRESEALYRQAIEVAGAVPYLQSYRSGITGIHYDFIGQGIRQITGYDPEEFDLQLWDSLVQESILLGELRQYAWEDAIRRIRTGDLPIWKCEHRIQARNGSIHWVLETAVELRDQTGVSHGSIGMFQDITERKQAEETLRLSEERYRILAQNMPDSALLLFDQELRFMIADGPEIEATGFSREKLEGKTLHEALPAWFAQLVEPNMRRALGGEKFHAELPFGDRFYRYSYAPLPDSSGRVVMAMILATNTTQLKQVEDALKDSQRRLSTALRETKVGVWEWDMRTNEAYWSDENYTIMGLEPGSVESKYENWAKCLHPNDLPAAEAKITEAVNNNSDLNIEFRVVWPDDSVHWINDIGSMLVDEAGQPLGMYGIQMDITERKQIQQELEENRRRLAFLISSSPSIIYSAMPSGGFDATFVSGNVTKLLGYQPEQFTADPGFWLQHIHPDDLPRINLEIGRLFETGSHNYEYRFRKADGRYIWMRDEMLVIRGESGNPQEIIGSWIDITEQKRAAVDREKLIGELETKNTELERFTYTVSHDLRSPLVTIKGFLGFLTQDIEAGRAEGIRNDLERISNAVGKMELLLKDLLELSRIGRLTNPSRMIPFNDIVQEALDLVHGQMERRGVTVHTQPGLPAVYGDRQRLVEVLQNLLENAVRYMGDQPDPRLEIGQRAREGNDPIFFVSDNGIGIAPEFHERIFGLFNKLDPRSDGSGVGLAIVKRVIELHHGRIWVESEAGRGSTFYFTLPAEPAPHAV